MLKKCSLSLHYGPEFFKSLDNGSIAWKQLMDVLTQYRLKNANEVFQIPDFGNSKEILNALVQLKDKSWKKLMSDTETYKLLRKELFGDGQNLIIAKQKRGE